MRGKDILEFGKVMLGVFLDSSYSAKIGPSRGPDFVEIEWEVVGKADS